ncbi:carboxypeptidase D [Trichophaea hybrida]|nr:carboxypeptidase D [Trichophaea hybrida]
MRDELLSHHHSRHQLTTTPRIEKRQNVRLNYFNDKTSKFYVNGTSIPDVDFDVGESYSGLLPISKNATESRELFFWFFPSTTGNTTTDELVIWLNGGPGCTSLEGLLQENGPFLWQTGTFKPLQNVYSWHKLANVLWVDQPVGTGFSVGTPNVRNEEEAAEQFLGFLEGFLETFGMQGRTTYVTGESYAGYFVPYIVDAMYKKNDTELFNPEGLMIYDPSITYDVVQRQIPAAPYVEYFAPMFGLNESFMAQMWELHNSCGYASFLDENLAFPPRGPLPTPPQIVTSERCDIWRQIFAAELLSINPCFNVYSINTQCPLLWDVMGFPGSYEYLPAGATLYFNRTDVQNAIHAPFTPGWVRCRNSSTDTFPFGDGSPPSALSVLPGLIDKNKRTVIAHGMLDYILIANGSLLAIQNMTWGGMQGFQEMPKEPFYIPFDNRQTAGKTHTERGLTWVEMDLTGHMAPGALPSGAYFILMFLLGRVQTLGLMGWWCEGGEVMM